VGGSGQVQFKVSVDEFLINFAIQRDMRFLVDVSMKEGKVSIAVFLLNGCSCGYYSDDPGRPSACLVHEAK